MNNKNEQKSLKTLLNSCDIFDENAPDFSEYSDEGLRRLLVENDRVNFVLQRKISWRMADEKRGK